MATSQDGHAYSFKRRDGWYIYCPRCGGDVMDMDGYDCQAGADDAADDHNETHARQDAEEAGE